MLWYVACHAARVPGDVLEEVAASLVGEHHRKALTALVQAGMRSEGLFLRELARSDIVAERAVAGLILLPGRTGPAFPALLGIARDGSAARKTRALALRYVAESPAGVALLPELAWLAETPGDLVVRTAAARALGRLPAAKPSARDAVLAIVASDVPDNVRIAALRSAGVALGRPQAAMGGAQRGRFARLAHRVAGLTLTPGPCASARRQPAP